jgi:hypothetical protein
VDQQTGLMPVAAWLDAADLDQQKRICAELQKQLWNDVPYIPDRRILVRSEGGVRPKPLPSWIGLG